MSDQNHINKMDTFNFTESNYIPPAWASGVIKYLEKNPEQIQSSLDLKTMISHAFIYENRTPPPEHEVDKLWDWISYRRQEAGRVLEGKLSRVYMQMSHEVCQSDNVLYHSSMTEERFCALVKMYLRRLDGCTSFITEIEDLLVKNNGFLRIKSIIANTGNLL